MLRPPEGRLFQCRGNPCSIYDAANCEHLTMYRVNSTSMKHSSSANSACTNRLGTCVLTGEDAIAFDERMKNPTSTPEQASFFKDAVDLHRRTKWKTNADHLSASTRSVVQKNSPLNYQRSDDQLCRHVCDMQWLPYDTIRLLQDTDRIQSLRVERRRRYYIPSNAT